MLPFSGVPFDGITSWSRSSFSLVKVLRAHSNKKKAKMACSDKAIVLHCFHNPPWHAGSPFIYKAEVFRMNRPDVFETLRGSST